MSILLVSHLIALGIWIGVVGAEFAIEFDGMRNRESRTRASKMHYQTDIWIEIPAFTVVIITGFLMLNESHLSGIFLYKILFGLLAIAFNIVCVYAVWKRHCYAMNGDTGGMDSTARAMKLGSLVIPTFLVAFGLSFYIAW